MHGGNTVSRSRAEFLLEKAERVRTLARKSSPKTRAILLDMAKLYSKMAEQASILAALKHL